MYCIVGLGNPGAEYQFSRHNAGFLALDALSEELNIPVTRNQLLGVLGSGVYHAQKLILVKPLTYMNNSGQCVRAVLDYYGVPLDRLIVIYDDIDLELGSLRIRGKGSPGSHNGMKSMVQHLGSGNFPRVRIGIGRPEHDLVGYVLHPFTREELKTLAIEEAARAALDIVTNDVEHAQSIYN